MAIETALNRRTMLTLFVSAAFAAAASGAALAAAKGGKGGGGHKVEPHDTDGHDSHDDGDHGGHDDGDHAEHDDKDHLDHDDADHADRGGGRRGEPKGAGPKYRGGREITSSQGGRGNSLEDRVLKKPANE